MNTNPNELKSNVVGTETPSCDKEILDFLKRQMMPGDIQLFLDRSPSFFDSLEVEGQRVKVMSIRHHQTNELMCIGCIGEKNYWINGNQREEKIGYLSSLRIDRKFQSSKLLFRTYEFLQNEHSTNHPDRVYLSTILEENVKAKKIFTSKRPGLPDYQDLGLLDTSFFPVKKQIWTSHFLQQQGPDSLEIKSGTSKDLQQLISFWKEQSKKRQFVPIYTEQDFTNGSGILRDFKIEDMILGWRNGKIVGCLGLWDQSAYRRWMVSAYSKKIQITKGIYNFFAPTLNRPKLPDLNEAFPYRILSCIAIDQDDQKIFESLLHALWKKEQKNDLVISIGFHEKDPLLSTILKHSKQKLFSRLYLTSWPDEKSVKKELDLKLVPYVEFGSL
ncbi:MAG: hypothetical protein ACK5P5_05535 [Pseudobdellovibrionaceae bacterium]